LFGQLSGGHFIKFCRSIKELKTNYKTSSVYNELFKTLFYLTPEFIKYRVYSSRRIGPSIINQDYASLLRNLKFETRISNSIAETSLISIRNILPVLLRYEDRNSMAFSVESRVPFLDHRLVEFYVNLPDDLKISK